MGMRLRPSLIFFLVILASNSLLAQGSFLWSKTQMPVVLTELATSCDVNVLFESEQLQNILVSASFKSQNADSILAVLAKTYPISVRKLPHNTFVITRIKRVRTYSFRGLLQSEDGKPLSNFTLKWNGNRSVITDSLGAYSLSKLKKGNLVVSVWKDSVFVDSIRVNIPSEDQNLHTVSKEKLSFLEKEIIDEPKLNWWQRFLKAIREKFRSQPSQKA